MKLSGKTQKTTIGSRIKSTFSEFSCRKIGPVIGGLSVGMLVLSAGNLDINTQRELLRASPIAEYENYRLFDHNGDGEVDEIRKVFYHAQTLLRDTTVIPCPMEESSNYQCFALSERLKTAATRAVPAIRSIQIDFGYVADAVYRQYPIP